MDIRKISAIILVLIFLPLYLFVYIPVKRSTQSKLSYGLVLLVGILLLVQSVYSTYEDVAN